MTESITYTGAKSSDKVECLAQHDFNIVDATYFSTWKECKYCGYRIIQSAPIAGQNIDYLWLNHDN